jgi:CheY-like chemotaxis protein
MVIGAHLRRRNHDVALAGDGVEAWGILSADLSAFDVVVTDIDMPSLDGFGLIQILREARFGGRIVVFSSSLGPNDRQKLRTFSVDAIVEKGSPVGDLLAMIELADDSTAATGR